MRRCTTHESQSTDWMSGATYTLMALVAVEDVEHVADVVLEVSAVGFGRAHGTLVRGQLGRHIAGMQDEKWAKTDDRDFLN